MDVQWYEMPPHRRGLDEVPLVMVVPGLGSKDRITKKVPVVADWWGLPYVITRRETAGRFVQRYLWTCTTDQVVFWCEAIRGDGDYQVFVTDADGVDLKRAPQAFKQALPTWWKDEDQREITSPTSHDLILREV